MILKRALRQSHHFNLRLRPRSPATSRWIRGRRMAWTGRIDSVRSRKCMAIAILSDSFQPKGLFQAQPHCSSGLVTALLSLNHCTCLRKGPCSKQSSAAPDANESHVLLADETPPSPGERRSLSTSSMGVQSPAIWTWTSRLLGLLFSSPQCCSIIPTSLKKAD